MDQHRFGSQRSGDGIRRSKAEFDEALDLGFYGERWQRPNRRQVDDDGLPRRTLNHVLRKPLHEEGHLRIRAVQHPRQVQPRDRVPGLLPAGTRNRERLQRVQELRGAMVPRGGIEPPTLRFSVACSTN